jgi:sulfite dehydrogenase
MLRGVDRALELAGWAFALMLAIMLIVGPKVIAEDRPADEGGEAAGSAAYGEQAGASDDSATTDDGGTAAPDGEALFTERCGSCHTLSAAGTSGSAGPNLDETRLDAAGIEDIVSNGVGSMPSFEGDLSDDEIAAVASFVAGN